MAFNVQFGYVEKNRNSTFTGGTGSHWLTTACVLKENSSVLRPSLLVDLTESEIFGNAVLNHAYISLYQRFYFVEDWTYERGRWRCDLSVDVMASWKTYIGNSRQYILRSESTVDGRVFDACYPTINDIDIHNIATGMPWTLTGGSYVVGIINGGGMGTGAVAYYAMTATQFHTFSSYLFGTSYLNTAQITQDYTMETFKALYNPFQYVVSCTFIPVSISGLAQQVIEVGYWTIPNTSGGRLTRIDPEWVSFNLPWTGQHPQHNRGDFVYCAPYTTVELDFQPFGHVSLPSDIVYEYGGIDVDVSIDIITGMGTAYIGGRYHPYMTLHAKVGVTIQLAQMSTDLLNTATTAISGVANTVGSIMTGDLGGAVANGIGAIDSTIRAQVPKLNTSGGNSGFSALVTTPKAIYTYYSIADDSPSRLGKPLCAEAVINSLSGYILCKNAYVGIIGSREEMEQIQSFMNSGFYYE